MQFVVSEYNCNSYIINNNRVPSAPQGQTLKQMACESINMFCAAAEFIYSWDAYLSVNSLGKILNPAILNWLFISFKLDLINFVPCWKNISHNPSSDRIEFLSVSLFSFRDKTQWLRMGNNRWQQSPIYKSAPSERPENSLCNVLAEACMPWHKHSHIWLLTYRWQAELFLLFYCWLIGSCCKQRSAPSQPSTIIFMGYRGTYKQT